MMDEQYLVGLADKVHRGQEGRVLNGFVAGGRCYGYRNVAIEDLSRMGEYGRPAIIGVKQEVNEAEAVVVRRMFDLYGSGRASLSKIAKIFNRENIPPPRPRTGFDPGWTHNGIRDMLRNERYIGMVVWNRRLDDTRKQYVDWQEFCLWGRSIIDAEGGMPEWLSTIVDQRCPGFLQAENGRASTRPLGLRLEDWMDEHIFGFAREEGWFNAVAFYAVRDLRYQRAEVCWSECVRKGEVHRGCPQQK